MTWTGRPDNQSSCAGPYGAVAGGETVARLLHSKIAVPDKAAFTRKELLGEMPNPSNVCGLSDGCSVDRVLNLSDAEISSRATKQADEKPGRTSEGALVGQVEKLREIRHATLGDAPAILVYDDPRADNDRHCVIRMNEAIPRTDFNVVRKALMDAFSRRVA